jgi:hypothetical protein
MEKTMEWKLAKMDSFQEETSTVDAKTDANQAKANPNRKKMKEEIMARLEAMRQNNHKNWMPR